MTRLSLVLFCLPLFAQNSPVPAIRSKLSAGDLLSAESLLEVYRKDKGEDATYLEGLAWVARGAALMHDWPKAARYASDLRSRCDASLAKGSDLDKDSALAATLGAAIEVHAEALQRTRGDKEAIRYLDTQLEQFKGPLAFRSRIYKRRNIIAMAGKPAPELTATEFIGANSPTLAALKGRPVVLFLWASWCGDCKAQYQALAAVKAKYAVTDLAWIAPTRIYPLPAAKDKASIEKVWKESYQSLNDIAVPISDQTMERYGVSSTPTFVFIERSGKVSRYTPTRLTEAELVQSIDRILRK